MKYLIICLILSTNVLLSNEWQKVEVGELGIIYSIGFSEPSNAFFSSYKSKGIYKSTDNGDNWNLVDLNLSKEPVSLTFYKNFGWLGVSPMSGIIKSEILLTTDYGENWVTVSNFQGEIPIQMKSIDSNKLFLLTIMPKAYTIRYSTDKGFNWTPIDNGNSQILGSCFHNNKFYWWGYGGNLKYYENGEVNLLNSELLKNYDIYEVFFGDNNITYASCNKGKVFKSINNGEDWIDLSNNLPNTYRVNSVYFKDENNGWVSGYDTIQNYAFVYSTINGGLSWQEDLKFNNSKFYDFAISNNNKLWIRGNNSLLYFKDIKTSINEKSEQFGTININPNPASDYITIQIQPSEGLEPTEGYKVQVFDMLGIEVVQLPLIEGNNRIDISNLPPGFYFIKIGDRVEKFVKM
jgi:photosystem II stability/assembly factor-like uncharacterized protein